MMKGKCSNVRCITLSNNLEKLYTIKNNKQQKHTRVDFSLVRSLVDYVSAL